MPYYVLGGIALASSSLLIYNTYDEKRKGLPFVVYGLLNLICVSILFPFFLVFSGSMMTIGFFLKILLVPLVGIFTFLKMFSNLPKSIKIDTVPEEKPNEALRIITFAINAPKSIDES